MVIPGSVTQLLVTLVLIVPGFVYQAVRIRLRGRTPGDNDLPARIMQAIVASTVFALCYIAIAGPQVISVSQDQATVLSHPRLYAGAGLVAAFVLPAVAAAVEVALRSSSKWKVMAEWLRPGTWIRVDPRPSAWDVAFESITPSFIRVRMSNGDWYAGWLGENSYASSWPDPRTVFVEVSYQVDERGTIGEPVEGSTGAVIDCGDAVLLELLQPGPSSTTAGAE